MPHPERHENRPAAADPGSNAPPSADGTGAGSDQPDVTSHEPNGDDDATFRLPGARPEES